jgi:hypothetical protein
MMLPPPRNHCWKPIAQDIANGQVDVVVVSLWCLRPEFVQRWVDRRSWRQPRRGRVEGVCASEGEEEGGTWVSSLWFVR